MGSQILVTSVLQPGRQVPRFVSQSTTTKATCWMSDIIKGLFPWRKAEFESKSWVQITFSDEQAILNPADFERSVRRVALSMPWDRLTEARYAISSDLVRQIQGEGPKSIEVSATGPNGDEKNTIFEMKPKWNKKLKERASCILEAVPKTEKTYQ